MVQQCATRLGQLEADVEQPNVHAEHSIVQVRAAVQSLCTSCKFCFASRSARMAMHVACARLRVHSLSGSALSPRACLQMLHIISGDLARRIMCEAPVSLLRLILILPPSPHAHAIQARTCATRSSDNATTASLRLANAKDLPPAAIAVALEALTLHASQLSSLAAISMADAPGSAAGSGATLARMFPLLSALTSLSLARCALGAVNGLVIVRTVPSLTQLAELDLSSNELGSDVMPAFEHWPARPLELTALSLADNAIGSAGLRLLQDVLPTKLKQLDISCNVLDCEVDSLLDSATTTLSLQPPLNLRNLCVSSTDVVGRGGAEIIALQAPSLTRLCVRPHERDGQLAAVHWRDFSASTTLQDVCIECRLFVSQGVPMQPVQSLTSLTLRLTYGLTMMRVVEALTSITQLRALSLKQSTRFAGAMPHRRRRDATQAQNLRFDQVCNTKVCRTQEYWCAS